MTVPPSTPPTSPAPATAQLLAVIGIGCLFPKAAGLGAYWANIRDGVDAITEVPASHWRPEDYLDADPGAPDHTVSARGGFLDPVDFDPLANGISPNNLEATDAAQLLGLVVAQQALADAGYPLDAQPSPALARELDRRRVSVILGVTGTLQSVIPLGARLGHPLWRKALADAGVAPAQAEQVVDSLAKSYVPWQENSFPGLLGNVVAGRIANRLDLGGTNCVVDAACASSLGAIHLAALELEARRSDVVITGGIDAFNDIFMYMCFSKTQALSPTGSAKPFDSAGDGTILGEGLGVLVLKRLDDARAAGDRIYAIIRGLGSSSDGKGGAVYAPKAQGQVKALEAAYQQAGISPRTVELVEGHGTGTKVGDVTEATSLGQVYSHDGPVDRPWCALGSVKSQIGHTKAAAGAAGLIKIILALHHKVLPPTIKVTSPIEPLADGALTPFYLNTSKRPWLPGPHPRRAAVSAFGFGGSNFHCVVEEAQPAKTAIDWDRRQEILAFSAESVAELAATLLAFPRGAAGDDLARHAARSRAGFGATQPLRLLITVDLSAAANADALLDSAARQLQQRGHGQSWSSPEGIYFGFGPAPGKLAFLFPGQGAQYPGMFRDLVCQFPQAFDALSRADRAFQNAAAQALPAAADLPPRLSDLIYPPPRFTAAARDAGEAALRATDQAQPALAALAVAAVKLLEGFGVRPDAAAGHSFGELPALWVAGCYDEAQLFRLAATRGTLMAQLGPGRGSMLAVQATLEVAEAIIRDACLDLTIANINTPKQIVLSGSDDALAAAGELFAARQIPCKKLRVAAAFHSKLVADAAGPFAADLAEVAVAPPTLPVYANTTAQAYPAQPQQIRDLLAQQLAQPVRFVDQIRKMHEDGVRSFVELGPSAVLTGLVGQILADRPHMAMAIDSSAGRRAGGLDLARLLCQLAVGGHAVELEQWQKVSADEVGGPSPASAPAASAGKRRLTVPICGANYIQPRAAAKPAAPAKAAASPAVATSSPAMPVQVAGQGKSPVAATMPSAPQSLPPVVQWPPAALRGETSGKDSGTTSGAVSGAASGTVPGAVSSGRVALADLAKVRPGVVVSSPTGSTQGAFVNNAPINPPAAPRFASAAGDPTALAQALRLAQDNLAALQQLQQRTAELHQQFLLSQNTAQQSFQMLLQQQQQVLSAMFGGGSVQPLPLVAPVTMAPVSVTAPPVQAAVPAIAIAPVPTAAFASIRGTAAAPASTAGAAASQTQALLLQVVAEKTGYPAEMLELPMSLDADLGIDSIKRVEIFATLQEKLPSAPQVKPEHLSTLHTLADVVAFLTAGGSGTPADAAEENPPLSPAATTALAVAPDGNIQALLLQVVAEKTGYPAEMLELPMSLDADLGIDSIKRVEIFATLQEKLPSAPQVKPEHLSTLHTLADVVAFLTAGTVSGSTPGTPGTPGAADENSRPAPAASTAATVAPDANVQALLLQVVAEKTGYPVEMLELPMALDADLGIDSIKRVEIFATLQEKLPNAPQVKPEHLSTLHTLADVVAFLGGATGAATNPAAAPEQAREQGAGNSHPAPAPHAAAPDPATPDTDDPATADLSVLRSVVECVPLASGPRQPLTLPTGSTVWITADGSDLAQSLAAQLAARGLRPAVVEPASAARRSVPADLSGLIILAPAGGTHDRFLRDAFALVKHCAAALRQTGQSGSALLATVSRLGGRFAIAQASVAANILDPLSGALAGLAKTARHEWPEVCCRALDLSDDLGDAPAVAETLAQELQYADPVEVGLNAAGKVTLALRAAPLNGGTLEPPLARDDVVVITGGGRGVTAEVAAALAESFGCTLALIGRSPLPAEEPDYLTGLEDEHQIKQALLVHAPRHQRTPRAIGEQCQRLLAAREIRKNLARIQDLGGQGRYFSSDVRDEQALAATLTQIRQDLGPVRGLIHGAGVLADRLIQDKTTQQFEDVYATKVTGLLNLLAACGDDQLKLLVLFSSSTARFGRRGQVDYAVANEALNKLAQQQAGQRPACRVLAVNWGPWDGGMVTPALRQLFASEGVAVIPVDAGAGYLMREISNPSPGKPVELVILGPGTSLAAGSLSNAGPAVATTPAVHATTFKAAVPAQCSTPIAAPAALAAPAPASSLALAIERELSLELCPVLRSHVLQGRAVLPAALLVELLASGAMHGNPGRGLAGLDDLRIFKGLTFDPGQSRQILVFAGEARARGELYSLPVELRSQSPERGSVLHARAELLLNDGSPLEAEPPQLPTPPRNGKIEQQTIYQKLLFHGPELQGIEQVHTLSGQGALAQVRCAPPPGQWFTQPLRRDWLCDPLALDCALQIMLLCRFHHDDQPSLPAAIGRYRQFAGPAQMAAVRRAGSVQLVVVTREHREHLSLYDAELLDQRGQLLARLEGCQCTADASLQQAFRCNRVTQDALG